MVLLCLSLAAVLQGPVWSAVITCSTDWYGPHCNMTCGSTCNNNKCQAAPEQGIYNCTSGCADGWMGSSCRQRCQRNCLSCDQMTGACSECSRGWCGGSCSALCSGSETGSGQCLEEACLYCKSGWYGPTCGSQCPEHCDNGCNKSTGICDHQCFQGLRGSLCTKPCSTTCNRGCQQTDGECFGGCQPGWFGPFCNLSCNSGCKDSICYQDSGECSLGVVSPLFQIPRCALVWKDSEAVSDCRKGCEAGWRGERCDQPCPTQCYSCPRFPTGRICLFDQDVTAIRTHELLEMKAGETIEKRVIYAMVLVLFPFVIVGFVQVLRVGIHHIRGKKKKEYELCESGTEISKC